jgi:hypothetical protein
LTYLQAAARTDEANVTMAGRWAVVCAGASIAIGLLALLGWMLAIAWLKGMDIHWVSMRVNTAAGIVAAGIGLLAQTRAEAGWQLAGRLAGALVVLLGMLTLAEYLFGWDIALDHLFYMLCTLRPRAAGQGHAGTASAGRSPGRFERPARAAGIHLWR